jgi:hypothetical protein
MKKSRFISGSLGQCGTAWNTRLGERKSNCFCISCYINHLDAIKIWLAPTFALHHRSLKKPRPAVHLANFVAIRRKINCTPFSAAMPQHFLFWTVACAKADIVELEGR